MSAMAAPDVEGEPLIEEAKVPTSRRPRLALALGLGGVALLLVAGLEFASYSDLPEFEDNPAAKDWQTRLASVRKSFIDEVEIERRSTKFELFGRTKTHAGYFEVWTFVLRFDSHSYYLRRFGVDMPTECINKTQKCPLLVDFHGSYDSLYSQRAWTGWFKYQAKTTKKFVLLTPEGSPDALMKPGKILNDCNKSNSECLGSSQTSWNVLGWGTNTAPVESDSTCKKADKASKTNPVCFWQTLKPKNAYACFGTHLDKDPTACQLTARRRKTPQIPTQCQSASGANDWTYMKKVMDFVDHHYKIDRERIYLTGQSMGGMSSLQWAMQSGDYDLGQYRPAAIAPCSAGAARSHYAELKGQVPTMLMWGYEDSIAPATAWQGYSRNLDYWLPKSPTMKAQILNGAQRHELKKQALKYTKDSFPTNPCRVCPHSVSHKDRKLCCLILWANTLSGGELLEGSDAQKYLESTKQLSCPNDMGVLTGCDGSAFMWEGVLTTLRGVTGDPSLKMSNLKFKAPDSSIVPKQYQTMQDMLCADVPNKHNTDIRVCIYQGGHTYPWKKSYHWMNGNSGGGQVFHDFVWKGFLKEGGVKRS